MEKNMNITRLENSKGKRYYYYNDKAILLFDGEFLGDAPWGYCKDYKFGHILQYEGEYLNGLRNGKGKEYDSNRKIIYEGEYLNGLRKNH